MQREERRQKYAEIRKQREEMTEIEQQTYHYRSTIDQFRLKFAKERAKLKIKTSLKNGTLPEPKIKVLVRKRPLNEKGMSILIIESSKSNFDIITTHSERYPFAHLYLHEPKLKLDLSTDIHTHRFEFDYVFDETATNEDVYKQAASSLVDSFLNGGRATLFA
jgi:kinesin family protein 2/24